MAFWRWGSAQARHVVVCAHGLTRQGRDFDRLAQTLLARSGQSLQVICPDVVGRGRSDWLQDAGGYQIPQYAADMLVLLAHVNAPLHKAQTLQTLDWVGTSMGGLIGLAVCAHAKAVGATVRRLVLNDVGPRIEWDSLARIASYVGKPVPLLRLPLPRSWPARRARRGTTSWRRSARRCWC